MARAARETPMSSARIRQRALQVAHKASVPYMIPAVGMPMMATTR
jgi:hypothetical protein